MSVWYVVLALDGDSVCVCVCVCGKTDDRDPDHLSNQHSLYG